MITTPKIIFLDLDGTIINREGVVSQKTHDMIRRVRESGILIAFASGRPTFAARSLMVDLGVNGLSSLYSGAVIFDPQVQRTILRYPLHVDPLRELIQEVRKSGLYSELYTENGYYSEFRNHLTDIHTEYMRLEPTICRHEDILDVEEILKFQLVAENADQEGSMREIMARFPQYSYGVAFGAAHPWIRFCSVTSAQASRKTAYDAITQRLGIKSDEVMAFGDGEADMTFLSLSGHGVAMGNAPAIVKSAARYVTKSVEEDGVAHALGALVFGEGAL